MNRKIIFKGLIGCMMALIVLVSSTLNVFASTEKKNRDNAGLFGILEGRLSEGIAIDRYEMDFSVRVDNAISGGYIEAHVDVTQGGTGTYIGSERTDRVYGGKYAYWYWEFFDLEDAILYGDTTYVVYGAHEAVSDTGYVVYTSNTYCYNDEEDRVN